MLGPAKCQTPQVSEDMSQSRKYNELIIWKSDSSGRYLFSMFSTAGVGLRTLDHLDIVRDEAHFILHLETWVAGIFEDKAARTFKDGR